MKTDLIKKEGSFSQKITEALVERGYPSRVVETVKKDGTTTAKILVTLGEAPCRTFANFADVKENLTEKQIVQYCTEKVHVLDKQAFEDSVLSAEGLKEVSVSKDAKATADAEKMWITVCGGAPDFTGTVKSAVLGKLTFDELKAVLLKG